MEKETKNDSTAILAKGVMHSISEAISYPIVTPGMLLMLTEDMQLSSVV